MFEGTLIMESLVVGTVLELPLSCRAIRRIEVAGTSDDQPPVWTLVDFEVADDVVDRLASALAEALGSPGWYADLRSSKESIVIFPGQVFRYRRGDVVARAEAVEHGRGLAIPEAQLDWPF